jgi:hypothetical protein
VKAILGTTITIMKNFTRLLRIGILKLVKIKMLFFSNMILCFINFTKFSGRNRSGALKVFLMVFGMVCGVSVVAQRTSLLITNCESSSASDGVVPLDPYYS